MVYPPQRKAGLNKVIFTGDDFGLAVPVNEAIVEAHRKGSRYNREPYGWRGALPGCGGAS